MAGLRNRPSAAATRAAGEESPAPEVAEEHTDVTDVIDDGVVNGVLDEPEAETEAEPEAETVEAEPEAEEPASKPKPKGKAKTSSRLEHRRAAREPKETKDPEDPKDTKPTTPKGSRPTGKRRTTGTTRPDDLARAERRSTSKHAKVEKRTPRVSTLLANRLNVAILLAVIAVVLGGLAYWFRSEANALGSGEGNTALTDTATTSEAISQLTAVVEDVFSYNYTDLDKTKNAVEAGLVGKASCEYGQLFDIVLDNAPAQQLVMTTEVRELAVERLEGGTLRAIAFFDQTIIKAGAANSASGGGGMLGIDAKRVGDHWKITDLDTFKTTLPNGQKAPAC